MPSRWLSTRNGVGRGDPFPSSSISCFLRLFFLSVDTTILTVARRTRRKSGEWKEKQNVLSRLSLHRPLACRRQRQRSRRHYRRCVVTFGVVAQCLFRGERTPAGRRGGNR